MTRSQTVIEEWLRKDRNPAPVAKLLGFELTGFEDGVARTDAAGRLVARFSSTCLVTREARVS